MLNHFLFRIKCSIEAQTLEKTEEMTVGEDFPIHFPRRDPQAQMKRSRELKEEGVVELRQQAVPQWPP